MCDRMALHCWQYTGSPVNIWLGAISLEKSMDTTLVSARLSRLPDTLADGVWSTKYGILWVLCLYYKNNLHWVPKAEILEIQII